MNNELTEQEIYCTTCKDWKPLKIMDGDDYMCGECNLVAVAIRKTSKPKDPLFEKFVDVFNNIETILHKCAGNEKLTQIKFAYKKFLELFGPELNGAQGLRFQDISFNQFLQIFNNWTGGDADEEVIEKVYKELLANAKRNELLTGGGE